MRTVHVPVLSHEVILYLNVLPGGKYIDATVGSGGHSLEIIKKGGQVVGIDLDPQILEYASRALAGKAILKRANFKDITQVARVRGFTTVEGILFDLGVSSLQLEKAERGFSINHPGPLDMRMDPDLQVRATDLVNGLNSGELMKLFSRLGQESYAKAIAKQIVEERTKHPLRTTQDLVRVVESVAGKRKTRIHSATRVFQALRIAVNDELNNLKEALPKAVDLLSPAGRLVVISFHSLEDRIVKNFFKERADLKILTEKPVTASLKERQENPRSRSAKLRAAEKV